MDIRNQWLSFRDPREIWRDNPVQLSTEILLYVIIALTFIHAVRNGGRYLYLWFAVVLHGVFTELVSYMVPDINSFWHAQHMVMFRGGRLPFVVSLIYNVYYYIPAVAVPRMKLKSWAEPFAIALGVVLVDLPLDFIGTKFTLWTWHDSDPNFAERFYGTPVTSLFFHIGFSSSLIFLFRQSHKLFARTAQDEPDTFLREMACVLVTGVFSMPMGSLQIGLMYNLPHDNFAVHSAVCCAIYIAIFMMITWSVDRTTKQDRSTYKGLYLDEISACVWIYFPFFMAVSVLGQPGLYKSTSLHETLGDCKETMNMYNVLGQILTKKRYLCGSNYRNQYYNWDCLPDKRAPPDGSYWYTTCATPHDNYVEYVVIVWAVCLLGLFVFSRFMLCFSPVSKPILKRVKEKKR